MFLSLEPPFCVVFTPFRAVFHGKTWLEAQPKAAFEVLIGNLLAHERRPFGAQEAAFCEAKRD